MSLGFICIMSIFAVICYNLVIYMPLVASILKYIGAFYIIYLAIIIFKSNPQTNQLDSKISFNQGFFLQFINVKTHMYAVTIYTGYILPISNDLKILVANTIWISIIGISGIIVWALMGNFIQNYLLKYYKLFNTLMAILLVICAIELL